MQLGWYDNLAPHKTYILPRKKGEERTTYARRFFAEIRGLGNCTLVVMRGSRRRRIARRYL
jgi:hypothetical protein